MVTTSEVGNAFWNREKAKGSSVKTDGEKLWSYNTVILQRLSNGSTIGNTTKYSSTTSRTQTQVGVKNATFLVDKVPMTAQDLQEYNK